MQVKFSRLRYALNVLHNKSNLNNGSVDISIREEDPGNGLLSSCMVIKGTIEVAPSQYDDNKSPIVQEWTLEVFSDSENREPILNCNWTQKLDSAK